MTFAQLEDFDVLITDKAPLPEDQVRVKNSGAQLIIAQ
jgi:DeoR/GlpR family transcriptional regulator of sugar metabolism